MKISKDNISKWFLIIWTILYLVVLFEEVTAWIQRGSFINYYKNMYDLGFIVYLPFLMVHLIFIIPIIAVYYIRKRLRKHS